MATNRKRRLQPANGEKTAYRLTINLTETEKQQAIALANGVFLQEHFRSAGLRVHRSAPVPQVNREIFLELGRIRGEMEQILRNCREANQAGEPATIDSKAFQELKRQLDLIQVALMAPDVRKTRSDVGKKRSKDQNSDLGGSSEDLDQFEADLEQKVYLG